MLCGVGKGRFDYPPPERWGFVLVFGLLTGGFALGTAIGVVYESPLLIAMCIGIGTPVVSPMGWTLTHGAHRAVVSDEGIALTTFLGRRIDLHWDEIDEVVEFSTKGIGRTIDKLLVISRARGVRVLLADRFRDFDQLGHVIRTHVPAHAQSGRMPSRLARLFLMG